MNTITVVTNADGSVTTTQSNQYGTKIVVSNANGGMTITRTSHNQGFEVHASAFVVAAIAVLLVLWLARRKKLNDTGGVKSSV